MPAFTLTLNKRKDLLNTKLNSIYTPSELENSLDLIEKILTLKTQKNVVILGHNYMTPDVLYGVSDFIGDSFALSKHALETNANIILFNGVHFMAETAKILNPNKKVLIADLKAGCSLAESISKEDVINLRNQYPNAAVVSYINCSAEIKAESDIICTSSNASKVIQSLEEDTIIMLPDLYLANNIALQTNKRIITWNGKCIVHELFTGHDIELARKTYPHVKIIAHPECSTEVTSLSDFTGSTSEIGNYIQKNKPSKVLLLTECSMGANLHVEYPQTEFIGTCQTCPHMKKITLEKIYHCLLEEHNEVHVPSEIALPAKRALDRMLQIV